MLKLIILAIILGMLLIFLKTINNDIFTLALIASGVIILIFSIDYLNESIQFFNKIISETKIDSAYIYIIFKIIGISYLAEFTSSFLIDIGLNSLSDKLVFSCKIIIFTMSLPIIYGAYNVISNIIK